MSNRVMKASRRIRRTRWFVYRVATDTHVRPPTAFLGELIAADLFEAERLASRKWGGDGFRIVCDC
jgi:hypothetical protein